MNILPIGIYHLMGITLFHSIHHNIKWWNSFLRILIGAQNRGHELLRTILKIYSPTTLFEAFFSSHCIMISQAVICLQNVLSVQETTSLEQCTAYWQRRFYHPSVSTFDLSNIQRDVHLRVVLCNNNNIHYKHAV